MRFLFVLILLAHASLAEPVTLSLKSGSVVTGELISQDSTTVQVKSEFGDIKIQKSRLTQESLDSLAKDSSDPAVLKQRIAELEQTVAELKRDNAALRKQLSSSPPPASSTALTAQPRTTAPAAAESGGSYTISSTGKRHNSRCRYYGSGRPGTASEGIACKICGG